MQSKYNRAVLSSDKPLDLTAKNLRAQRPNHRSRQSLTVKVFFPIFRWSTMGRLQTFSRSTAFDCRDRLLCAAI